MPHSSGGGSHGGGFHSGSGSSFSRSGSSSSRGPAPEPIRRRPYAGATRYVWYGTDGSCRSLYHKGKPDKPSVGMTIVGILAATLIMIPIIFVLMVSGLRIPKALDTASYESNVIIMDKLGLVEGAELPAAMKQFRNKTGVTPAVEAVPNGSWEADYTGLEAFALSEYLRLFNDEKHWLFVISWPEDAADTSFTNWSWEGMIGDECGPAIDSDAEKAFTRLVHQHLLRATPETVGEELAKAFTEFSETCMEKQVVLPLVIVAAVVTAAYVFLVYILIRDYRDSKRLFGAVAAPKDAKECNCAYCGTLYVEGTVTKCPSCGAPIPAHNAEENA